MARSELFTAVSGSALITGCIASGKLADEKKTPDKTHIGSMAKFISPDAASTVLGRAAIRRPRPPKASDPSRQTTDKVTTDPRRGTPKTRTPNVTSVPTSNTNSESRANKNDSRYSARDIGVATNRLRSFLRRWSTTVNPMPHMLLAIRFIPSRPGTRKSMYRDPRSRTKASVVATGSWRPLTRWSASSTIRRAVMDSGRVSSKRYSTLAVVVGTTRSATLPVRS